jgi:hypothetical protein
VTGVRCSGHAATGRRWRFNAAIGDGRFDPSILDGKAMYGLEPPKSNWALRIERPPFVAYRVAAGSRFHVRRACGRRQRSGAAHGRRSDSGLTPPGRSSGASSSVTTRRQRPDLEKRNAPAGRDRRCAPRRAGRRLTARARESII